MDKKTEKLQEIKNHYKNRRCILSGSHPFESKQSLESIPSDIIEVDMVSSKNE
ncbi:MAG: hypothetical protein KAU06_08940 [Candidatus Marinimicrobia bacterium]|nr:hypothetical protein [Candidatus Neomarinimicrobiota bacterium]